MYRNIIPAILAFVLVAGCVDMRSERAVVEGTAEEEFLNLRTGPGLGFSVILGLPDGTSLNRGECVTELGQLWCAVSLAAAPQISGYVSADYLSAP